jgi:hypothetical protein
VLHHPLLVSAGYACVTATICLVEARRIRSSGPDVVTVFMVIFVLQCCAPGIAIYACLPFVDPLQPTGIRPFDRIYAATDLQAALLVLSLTACFAFCFYVVTALSGALMGRVLRRDRSPLVLTGSSARLVTLLAAGFTLCVVSFLLGGDTLAERYANLILLRGYSEEVKPTLLNGVTATSIEGWAWLSVAALFVTLERRRRGLWWLLCLLFVVTFAILAVSRRDLFIPILLVYLTLLLFDGRWRPSLLLATAVPVIALIAYGKEFFSEIAAGGSLGVVSQRYDTLADLILRSSSDMGLTIVESMGSINLLDLPPRFGIDHLMSMLPRIYSSSLHLGLDLPPRIVRLSTEAFGSPSDQDIPPGLFGQMWLDFRAFGPVAWATVLGLQVSVVQRIFAMTVQTRQAAAVFAVITFVIALPLNTGSYDFTFTLSVLVLVLGLFLTFKLERISMDRLVRQVNGTCLPTNRAATDGR